MEAQQNPACITGDLGAATDPDDVKVGVSGEYRLVGIQSVCDFITPRVSNRCNSFDIVCLTVCPCVCVCYHFPRQTNRHTDMNFGM